MSYPILGPFVPTIPHANYLFQAAQKAWNDQGNTFMIYSPRNSIPQTPTKITDYQKMARFCKTHQIEKKYLVAHAPFMINIANPINEKIWHFSVHLLEQEINFCSENGFSILVLHPGFHLSGTIQQGLERIIKALNQVLEKTSEVKIALETMSGKGTELGINFTQFRTIITSLKKPERVGVCLDTCHLHDAGYDLDNWNQVKIEIQKTIGFQKIYVIHLNDSKNDRGTHKDRHENIGYGKIGFANLEQITWDSDFQEVPKILETPSWNNQDFYKAEIMILRNKKFINYRSGHA